MNVQFNPDQQARTKMMLATTVDKTIKSTCSWTVPPRGAFKLDCLLGLQQLDSKSVPLVFADLPYGTGYKYHDFKDNLTEDKYLDWCDSWLPEIYRVTAANGSFWIQIGDKYAAELVVLAKSYGFYMRSWCIWNYTFGQSGKNNFGKCHAHLLYFVKDKKNYIFNGDDIRIPSDRQTKYNDKRANPDGKIPDDVWIESRICGNYAERQDYKCQTPEAIMNRIIKCCSNEGDLVVDICYGSGTTLAVAKKLGREFLGFDNSEHAYKITTERLAKIQEPTNV